MLVLRKRQTNIRQAFPVPDLFGQANSKTSFIVWACFSKTFGNC